MAVVEIKNEQATSTTLNDGLVNLATGLGTGKDKSTGNRWEHSGRNYDHPMLSARFRECWISQKVCKIVPQDMTREWRTFEDEQAQEADEHFGLAKLYRDGYQWARLYGTSFLIMDIADGRSVDKPVNWRNLKKGCLRSMHIVDRTRVVAIGEIDQDPMSPTYGMPATYQYVNSTVPIHHSRVIRFEGTELPIYERMRNLWYSDSILIPLMEQMDNFHTTSSAAAQMVQEANIDVISVEGLGNILQNSKGTAAMLARFESWKQIKSVFSVSILDSTETFDQKKIQLSGVKDLIWEYLRMVSASVGIPATRFLSASPDGMNATGESDLINYIELLQGLQKDVFAPRLKLVDHLMAAHFEMDIEQFKYKWGCIFPESASQKTEREKNKAETLGVLTDSGIISRESALEEAKLAGIVSKDAKVGQDPNPAPTTVVPKPKPKG